MTSKIEKYRQRQKDIKQVALNLNLLKTIIVLYSASPSTTILVMDIISFDF